MGVQDLVAELYQDIVSEARQGRMLTEFVVLLHPTDYARLLGEVAELPAFLETEVTRLVKGVGVKMPASLQITIQQTQAVDLHTVKIEGEEFIDAGGTTQSLKPIRLPADPQSDIMKLDAFLIVNGKLHVELDKSTITIGRGLKNDIVLASPKISRLHAQIRWRYGKFVLYDLGSRAGTYVNAIAIHETVLAVGDVITLSEATLIYGEGFAQTGRSRTPYRDSHTLSMTPLPKPEE
jgi:hypothetical protein